MTILQERIEQLARTPVLLVASDYDGTLAPIVANPDDALPCREAIVAMRQLASLPKTHAAVVSGRALRDLSTLTGSPDDVHLVGSHGSEFDLNFAVDLPPEAVDLRERIGAELEAIAAHADGLTIERKPASVALHFRNADADAARHALDRVMAGPAAIEAVFTKHGKKVVELGVVPPTRAPPWTPSANASARPPRSSSGTT